MQGFPSDAEWGRFEMYEAGQCRNAVKKVFRRSPHFAIYACFMTEVDEVLFTYLGR